MEFHEKTVAEFVRELNRLPFFTRTSAGDLMAKVPLLVGLSKSELEDLAEHCYLRQVKAGEMICCRGEYDTAMHVIVSGKCTVEGRCDERKIILGTYEKGVPFGRLTGESEAPSIVTVTAAVDSVLLEFPPHALDMLLKASKAMGEMLTRINRRHTIMYNLRMVPLFAELNPEGFDSVLESGRLCRYERGETIIRQGDEGDSLHVVLNGIVKVSSARDGGERILAYLKRGAYFGEMALVKNERRMASVIAVSNVETFQIMKDQFERVVQSQPALKVKVDAVIAAREAENIALESDPARAERLRFMEDFIESGDILVIDLERCVRCDNCVEACRAARGHPRLERRGERVGRYLVVTACRHCTDPACMLCKRSAIVRDQRGEIRFLDNCIGCGFCARQCPYGNITIVEERDETTGKIRKRAVKCDLCPDLPYPPCIYNCPTGASHRMKPEELLEMCGLTKAKQ